MTAHVRAAGTARRSSRPRASSRSCSGACSPAAQDYAHQQPSLTKKKLRRLEITAGAPRYAKTARGVWSSNVAIRQAERQLAAQAEASYKRMVKRPAGASSGTKSGRERDTGARMK